MPANPEIVQFIKEYAATKGIDPAWAVRVAGTEGLNVFDPNRPDHGGDGGSSFGVFQLHYGGVNPKMAASGLGDEFTRVTGLNARDPSTWREQVKFALDVAAKDGWRQWYGARDNGIPRWAGIKEGAAGAIEEEKNDPNARYDPRRDTPSPGNPTGAEVSQYALKNPVGPGGDDVTTSPANIPGNPYSLPIGTEDNPLITRDEDKPTTLSEGIGKGLMKGIGKIQGSFDYNVPNPVPTELAKASSVPMLDPQTMQNQRMMLAYAIQRLNSGKLA